MAQLPGILLEVAALREPAQDFRSFGNLGSPASGDAQQSNTPTPPGRNGLCLPRHKKKRRAPRRAAPLQGTAMS